MNIATTLTIFLPTFFLVSISPGMCMMLAMTLGMQVGLRKTLYMMLGELLGVATVAIAAVLGVATMMQKQPEIFQALKYIGALYLCYVAYSTLRTANAPSEKLKLSSISKRALFNQGYITAIGNPKGWAFMISLLPPFIDQNSAIAPQVLLLLTVILLCEFISMMIYATGGKSVARLLTKPNNIKRLNTISGLLMFGIAMWLFVS